MDTKGPFEQVSRSEPPQKLPDRTATIIVVAGIALGLLLLLLVLPPISILGDDDGSSLSGSVVTVPAAEFPAPPAGFEAMSVLFEISTEGPVLNPRLTLDLLGSVSADTDLTVFTYENDRWEQLGEAVVIAEGTAAQVEMPVLPGNVAVFRAAVETRAVIGTLRPGDEIDPRALSALTELRLSGFEPASDGRISGGPVQTPEGVTVPVVALISASEPSQTEPINTILASPELRAAHVQALVELVENTELSGIHLDYRMVDRLRGDEFLDLVQGLSSELLGRDATLSLTLALPERQGEEWETHGMDWAALASVADSITLATDTVAPDEYYDRLEALLGFLVPQVGSSKLLLSVEPLSRERGVDGSRLLTLTEALSLASTPVLDQQGAVAPEELVQAMGQNLASEAGASGLRWDDVSRSVTFAYVGSGGERRVWLTNVLSVAFKLDLGSRYQLAGVAVNDVSTRPDDANIWPAAVQYVNTGSVDLVRPNGELLKPRWTASGGVLESDVGALVGWRAPAEPGTYVLTLIVSDGVVRVGQEMSVSVGSGEGVAAP